MEFNFIGLDELDNKIVGILMTEARLSYSEIGERVGLSRVAVRNRMEALEERGFIRGYTAVLDLAACDEGRHFFIDISTTPECFQSLADMLGNSPAVIRIYALTGDSRIRIEGCVFSNQMYEKLIRDIKEFKDGIKGISVHEVLYTLKDLEKGVGYDMENS